ncbi:MAG: SpoIID/LytB domain-containing protein [Actinomycetota bacterium]|nr:SpoIID/LytB domain-containing protein [Actinomycetota bacterium]
MLLLPLVAGVVAAPSGALAAPPSAAAADTTVVLDGHGYGHGYGLSQWGAYGYAVDHSWTSAQILNHYYGGTVAGTVPLDSVATVRLMNLDNAQTAVVSASGGLVVDGVAGGPWKSVLAREVAPSVYSVWARTDAQVCPGTGDPVATGWSLVAPSVATQVNIRTQADSSAATDYADLASVCEPGGNVRSYRGFIRAVNGTAGENRTVNEVPLEQYLRSVIAKEMSPSWATAGGGKGAQALQAQAVAARSFALAENRYSYARTCDQICQAYMGAAMRSSVAGTYTRIEYPGTDAAVAATAGVVRRVGNASGAIALTMFSAASGGWTAPGPGGLVPFPAVVDEGDDTTLNPNFNWATSLTGSAIAAKYPSVGVFGALTVLARNGFGDWGGRVTSVRISGSAGSVTVTGDAFRSAFGLKSNWFNVRGSAPSDPCDGRNAPAIGATPPPAAAARYTPITPVRLLDTRYGQGTVMARLNGGCTLVVDPGLDASVTAVAVNLTAVRPVINGYVAAYPCGVEKPVSSAVQAIANRAVAGMTIVPLGADGTFCVYSHVTTDMVVDLFGTYAAGTGSKYEPINPVRLHDSRSGATLPAGTVVRVPVVRTGGAPAGATAAALTLHATGATAGGYATAYPCTASPPAVSSINVVSGASVTNHVEVALNGAGEVCVFISTAMHVTVDLSGWYGAAATSEFYAITPVRALDTRYGVGLSGAFAAGVDRSVTLAGANGLPAAGTLRAVMAEVTAVAPTSAGYITVHPCVVPLPNLSMVRYLAASNAATAVAGADDASGRWCITTSNSVHVLVDISGYFA